MRQTRTELVDKNPDFSMRIMFFGWFLSNCMCSIDAIESVNVVYTYYGLYFPEYLSWYNEKRFWFHKNIFRTRVYIGIVKISFLVTLVLTFHSSVHITLLYPISILSNF